MTKAGTKKRRGRPRKDGPREQNGRIVRAATRSDRERAVMAVVEARCRAVGIWPGPVVQAWGEPDDAFEARKAARLGMIRAAMAFVGLPWMGTNAGRRLAGYEDVAELWGVITMIGIRHAAYLRAIDAPRQVASMPLMVAPDRQTPGDAADAVAADMRSDEERAADAIAAWERLAIPDDLVLALAADTVPESYPLATKLREIKAQVDGEAPPPVTRGQGIVDVARSSYIIECGITFPGGKAQRQVLVVPSDEVDAHRLGLGLLEERGVTLMEDVARAVRA